MDFTTIKTEMDTVFSRILAATSVGDAPVEEDVNSLVRLIKRLAPIASDDWADELEDFAHMANQLLQAVRKNHSEDCILIVDSLNDAQAYCHRTFKD